MMKFSRSITEWWWGFTTQTRLLAAATLVIVAVSSGFTFWAVDLVQRDARQSDQLFGESVGQLLAANAAPHISTGNIGALTRFTKTFVENNPNILYVIYFDRTGNFLLYVISANRQVTIIEGSPFKQQSADHQALLPPQVDLPKVLPATRYHSTPSGRVTDIFYSITQAATPLGVVALGLKPDLSLVTSQRLTTTVSIGVGLLVAAIALLGAVFNALTITRPLKELAAGVRGISQRNFQQRIALPFGGELGELIRSFNIMAERLQHYEAQNIDTIQVEKARLETLTTTIADGALLLDQDLRIMLSNPAAERILLWSNHHIGQNFLDRLPVGLRAEIEEPLVKVVSGSLELAECRVLLTDPRRTLQVLMSPVLKGRKVDGVVLTIQDISREAELNEAKSRFISNVSHELRTPLFCIKSFIETLLDYQDELDEAQKREFLTTANQETDRLTRLVNDVLDLSKLESGREYLLEPMDLSQAVEQTLRTYVLSAQEKNITLGKEFGPNLPLVLGNYDLLTQLLANLLGNALKFTPAGGRVTIQIHCYCDGELERVRLAVQDTGIGIDLEDQKKIFQRFYRVENKVHTLEGTGLGLSIVSNIAEKHNTQIQIESVVGQGTTFWIDLDPYHEARDYAPV